MTWTMRWNPFATNSPAAPETEARRKLDVVQQQLIENLQHQVADLLRMNVELAREVIRLSQRVNPVLDPDEDIEDPPTTRDNDMREARRGEQIQAPKTKGKHGI